MTLVEMRFGTVEGIERGGVLQFRGIPFAASPVGDLRWRSPQPPPAWAGVRPAHEFGPLAPQGTNPVSLFAQPDPMEIREDGCLHLNVFTPCVDREPRPVMVLIHGGGFP